MGEGKLCPQQPARTCEDGLVDPQRGGPDFDDPDVRRHLVANYKGKSRAAPSGRTSSARRPGKPQPRWRSQALPQGLGPPVCTSAPAVSPHSLFQLLGLQGRAWLLLRIATSLRSAGARKHRACSNEGSSLW